jgi:nucleotide-binding universal stress UspA family protein
MREVPQPGPHRIEPVAGQPVVVGVTPGQSPLVVLTAATWAQATGGRLYCGYADPTRIVDHEAADGTVRHSPLEPDREDDDWRERRDELQNRLAQTLAGSDVAWELRYLAGRADRALTHLARAVGASAIVVGARQSRNERVHEFFAESVGLHLARHQHRPVLVVPLSVVDWKAPAPWQ